MRRVLSSPRRRRRLIWFGATAALVTALAFVSIKLARPSPPDAPLSNEPAVLVKQPKRVKLTRRERARALAVAARFVATAVARRNVGASWDIVSPSLKQGFTRKTWARGNIPVVPYPVGMAKWRLTYAYRNTIGLNIAVFPRKGSRLRPTVFDLDLTRARTRGGHRWLVESFFPSGTSGGSFGIGPRPVRTPRSAVATEEAGARSRAWFVVPLLIPAFALLLLIGFPLATWYRSSRAYRAYLRERQTASSRPS